MDGVTDANAALFTDLYELRMARSYFERGIKGRAVFDLFVRALPPQRNYLIAAGLDDVLRYLEGFAFSAEALQQLAAMDEFPDAVLERFAALRFTGDVYAVPEGTPIFAGEPIIEVVAPLPEAQLVETYLINQGHFQTAIASKGARVVDARDPGLVGPQQLVLELQIVRRIGEDHVDAAFGQLGHELDAIAGLDDVDFHPGAPATSDNSRGMVIQTGLRVKSLFESIG